MIDLEKLSKEKAPLIDKELASVFSGNVPSLHDAIKYHLGTGGKAFAIDSDLRGSGRQGQ